MNSNSGKVLSSKWTIKQRFIDCGRHCTEEIMLRKTMLVLMKPRMQGERENRQKDDYPTMHVMAGMIRRTFSEANITAQRELVKAYWRKCLQIWHLKYVVGEEMTLQKKGPFEARHGQGKSCGLWSALQAFACLRQGVTQMEPGGLSWDLIAEPLLFPVKEIGVGQGYHRSGENENLHKTGLLGWRRKFRYSSASSALQRYCHPVWSQEASGEGRRCRSLACRAGMLHQAKHTKKRENKESHTQLTTG